MITSVARQESNIYEHLEPIMTDEFRNRLIRKCVWVLECSLDAAEDIVQNVYLALLKSKSFKPSLCSIEAYAYMRLRGVMSNWARDETLRSSHVKTSQVHCEIEAERDVFLKLDSDDELRFIKRRSCVSDRRWSIVVRHFVMEYSCGEIARMDEMCDRGVSWMKRKAVSEIRENFKVA